MTIAQSTAADVAVILSHRHDQGADWWTTPDRKLLKGAPFTTLESALYLMELGVTPQHEALEAVAQLIFDAWRDDGRIKTAPSGGLYPCHTAPAPRPAGAKSCKISKKAPQGAQKTGPEPLPNRQGCDILPPITHLCRPCDCAARVRGGRIGPM